MKALVSSLAIAGVAFAAIAQQNDGYAGTAAKSDQKAQTVKTSKGVQKATILVDNGFSPSTIHVKAGRPVQLTFDTKHKACISSVNFPGLKLTKDLTDGKKTVFTFTPKKGSYAFACPMRMMTGKVIAK